MAASISALLDQGRAAVHKRSTLTPRVAMVLGSGLGAFADTFDDSTMIPYEEIEGIPSSGVTGHAGRLVLGRVDGVPVIAMQGRAHLYEGYDAASVVFGSRLMVRLGASTVIITNAAGGLDPAFQPGDLMLIEDHLNLTGQNCLVGANDDTLGPRFPDMSVAYDRELRQVARETGAQLGIDLRSGVYAGLLGPTYETPAEIRMLRTLGASAVGMSTVLETIAVRHMGARVLGISCITNLAAGMTDHELSHEEVKETADRVKEAFVGLLRGVVGRLA